MVKFSQLIRDQDVFGHDVSLHFNKQAAKHTTVTGGIMSIVVKVGMLAFTMLLFWRLLFFKGDSIALQMKIMNFTRQGEVDYHATESVLAFGFSNNTSDGNVPYTLDMHRFISLSFEQR
jgi:extradiol dioxygenase family protein